MLPSLIELPVAYRAVDFFGSQLEKRGMTLTRLDVETLQGAAMRKTGFSDFGDTYYLEGLRVLLESIKRDAHLRFYGRLVIKFLITNFLSQRLLFVNAQKHNPEIFQSNLNTPFFVTGIHRSGTTFLHLMLSLDPRNAGIPFWRLYRPFPIPNRVDLRKLLAWAELSILHPIFPQINSKHIINPHEPEESTWMLGLTFHAIVFWILAPVSSYITWLCSQNLTNTFMEYGLLLKVQQAIVPDKKLVLKAPDHSPNLNNLLSTLPNARIIQLHRDPATAVISLCSLFYSTHGPLTNDIQPERLAKVNIKMVSHYLEKNRQARTDPILNQSILDIAYEDLISDPIDTVKGIYSHFGEPYTEDFNDRLVRFFAQQGQQKPSAHHQYTPEQFGYSRRDLDALFKSFS